MGFDEIRLDRIEALGQDLNLSQDVIFQDPLRWNGSILLVYHSIFHRNMDATSLQ